jgi:hypothetical protein
MANELFKIYSSLDPIAHSGDTLKITVSQKLLKGAANYLSAPGPQLQVAVQGPQINLTEDDISGVYPAPGSNDSPDNFLPHIALTRRTLPWERTGPKASTAGQPTVPWLALLILTEADMTLPAPIFNPILQGALSANIHINHPGPIEPRPPIQLPLEVKSVVVNTLSTSDAKSHTALTAIPGIVDSTTINAVSIPNATLANILPAIDDLALLCHAKEVNQDGVVTTTSIVVSGRLPNAGPFDPNSTPPKHLAVLVSLEQRGDVYTRLKDAGTNTLVVLHCWSFIPSWGADFEEVCQMIGYHGNSGVLRFGNLPSTLADPTKAPLSGGFDALLNPSGFFQTPLEHSESGNVIWRSPLRPFPPAARSQGFAIRAEPEELENQPADAPLDYSHATAFELGRLLAVADDGIRQDLREVHQFLQLPTGLVAMSNLPQILQKPYWGVDLGDNSLPPEALTNEVQADPWAFSANQANQSILGISNQLGKGDVSGIGAQQVAWQQSVVTQFGQAQAPVIGSVAQIDISQVNEATLALQFPELINAALISGRG